MPARLVFDKASEPAAEPPPPEVDLGELASEFRHGHAIHVEGGRTLAAGLVRYQDRAHQYRRLMWMTDDGKWVDLWSVLDAAGLSRNSNGDSDWQASAIPHFCVDPTGQTLFVLTGSFRIVHRSFGSTAALYGVDLKTHDAWLVHGVEDKSDSILEQVRALGPHDVVVLGEQGVRRLRFESGEWKTLARNRVSRAYELSVVKVNDSWFAVVGSRSPKTEVFWIQEDKLKRMADTQIAIRQRRIVGTTLFAQVGEEWLSTELSVVAASTTSKAKTKHFHPLDLCQITTEPTDEPYEKAEPEGPAVELFEQLSPELNQVSVLRTGWALGYRAAWDGDSYWVAVARLTADGPELVLHTESALATRHAALSPNGHWLCVSGPKESRQLGGVAYVLHVESNQWSSLGLEAHTAYNDYFTKGVVFLDDEHVVIRTDKLLTLFRLDTKRCTLLHRTRMPGQGDLTALTSWATAVATSPKWVRLYGRKGDKLRKLHEWPRSGALTVTPQGELYLEGKPRLRVHIRAKCPECEKHGMTLLDDVEFGTPADQLACAECGGMFSMASVLVR